MIIWNFSLQLSWVKFFSFSRFSRFCQDRSRRIEINCANYKNWHISKVLSLVKWFKKGQCHATTKILREPRHYTQLENWIAVDDYLWNDGILTTLRRYATDLMSVMISSNFSKENIFKHTPLDRGRLPHHFYKTERGRPEVFVIFNFFVCQVYCFSVKILIVFWRKFCNTWIKNFAIFSLNLRYFWLFDHCAMIVPL